jgi:hypothetical protein
MEIFFCEKCGKRISDAEIENGYAVKAGGFVYCRKCAPVQDAAVQTDAGKRGRKTSAVRTSTGRTDHIGAGSQPVKPASRYALIGVVLVVVFVVAGILLFRTSEKPDDTPPPPKAPKAQKNDQLPPLPDIPAVSQTQTTVSPSPVPPKPAETAVVAPTPAATTLPNEELLYAWDLKGGDLGWDGGRRVEDASRSAGVYENTKPDGSLTNRMALSSYAMKLPDKAFFIGSRDVFVSLEYFVTGGNEPVNFTVTIWDDKNKKNCYHPEVAVAKDRWNPLRLAAKDFIMVGNEQGRTPEDAVVRDLKFLINPENQGAKLRVSGIRITRFTTAPVKQSREVTVFEADFEQDANGWTKGERESGNVPEGSKWAYRAVPPAEGEFRSEEICVQAQDFRPERQNLFITGENMSVSFDYFIDRVDEPEGLVVMVRNFSKRNNPRRYMDAPVQGKWAHLTLPLKYLTREGTTPVPGDIVTEFYVQIQSGKKDMVLIIDNVRFTKEVPEPGR